MSTFEGMNPELVRDISTDVKRAAKQLSPLEGKITSLLSTAGLSVRTSHRPAQIAEDLRGLAIDIGGRLDTLNDGASDSPTNGEKHADSTPLGANLGSFAPVNATTEAGPITVTPEHLQAESAGPGGNDDNGATDPRDGLRDDQGDDRGERKPEREQGSETPKEPKQEVPRQEAPKPDNDNDQPKDHKPRNDNDGHARKDAPAKSAGKDKDLGDGHGKIENGVWKPDPGPLPKPDGPEITIDEWPEGADKPTIKYGGVEGSQPMSEPEAKDTGPGSDTPAAKDVPKGNKWDAETWKEVFGPKTTPDGIMYEHPVGHPKPEDQKWLDELIKEHDIKVPEIKVVEADVDKYRDMIQPGAQGDSGPSDSGAERSDGDADKSAGDADKAAGKTSGKDKDLGDGHGKIENGVWKPDPGPLPKPDGPEITIDEWKEGADKPTIKYGGVEGAQPMAEPGAKDAGPDMPAAKDPPKGDKGWDEESWKERFGPKTTPDGITYEHPVGRPTPEGQKWLDELIKEHDIKVPEIKVVEADVDKYKDMIPDNREVTIDEWPEGADQPKIK